MKFVFVIAIFSLQLFGLCNVSGIRVSRKKCDNYRKTIPVLSTAEDAALKEFPFMAKVMNTNGDYTNGILISENFVLSIEIDSSSTIIAVVLGDLKFKTDENNDQSRAFEVVDILYPGFNDLDNNIRLLKLNESIRFNEYIQPACISQSKCDFSQRLLAVGWSDTNVRNNDFLHKVKLNYISNGKCKEAFEADYKQYIQGIENKTHFCAAAAEERDMCKGFVGAALLPMSSLNEISGMVVFKRGCGHIYPYIYVGISTFTDWIESNVWPSDYKKYKGSKNLPMENCTETEYKFESDIVTMKTLKEEKELAPTTHPPATSAKTFYETFDFKTYIIMSLIVVISMMAIILSITFILLLKYKSENRQMEPVCETLLKGNTKT